MRPAVLLVLLALAGCAGSRPRLSSAALEDCADQGGCAYVTQRWVQARIDEARRAGVAEAKAQCGERTGINGRL